MTSNANILELNYFLMLFLCFYNILCKNLESLTRAKYPLYLINSGLRRSGDLLVNDVGNDLGKILVDIVCIHWLALTTYLQHQFKLPSLLNHKYFSLMISAKFNGKSNKTKETQFLENNICR